MPIFDSWTARPEARIWLAEADTHQILTGRHTMNGLYFEELPVGLVIEHRLRRTVTEMDNTLFSALTHNPQPLHIDHEFARTESEFGQPLVNSLFTLGLMIGISVNDTTVGTTVANLGMENTVFPAPVFHGDTIRVTTEVVAARESKSRQDAGIVTFRHVARKQSNEVVAECTRAALMKRRPANGSGESP